MRRSRTAFTLIGIWATAAIGCGEAPQGTETESAALFGAPVSGVHGFTRNNGIHGVVYKSLATGTVAEVEYPSGLAPQHFDLSTAQVLNTPSGLKRTDNVNAIVFISTNQHFHEVTQSGSTGPWTDVDFTNSFGINAPIPFYSTNSDTFGYIRTDNRNIYIYRDFNGHIVEIASNFGSSPPWIVSDLTNFTGALPASGNAYPYIRSDNKNAIVYLATDGHIHEISSNFSGHPAWVDTDLFLLSGLSLTISQRDPWAYKRVDNVNSVVFTDGSGNLREIFDTPGITCSNGLPRCNGFLAFDVNPSFNRPSGYVRWDNRDAVVYISSSNTLNEMSHLANQGWVEGTIQVSSLSGGTVSLSSATQLFGHRAPGSFSSVLFEAVSSTRGTDPFEVYLGTSSWQLRYVDTF